MRNVLAAELLKWERTPFLGVTIAATLASPLLDLLLLSRSDVPVTWDLLLGQILVFHVTLIGPLVVTLIGAQSIAVEYQCGTWRTILTTPTPRWKVYLAKWLVGFVWILGLTALVTLASWPAGRLLNAGDSLHFTRWAGAFVVAGVGLTAMLPVYQLITLLFRSLFVTSGIGVVGTFVGYIALLSQYAGFYPTSAVMILATRVSQHLQFARMSGTPEVWISILAILAIGSLLAGLLRLQHADIH